MRYKHHIIPLHEWRRRFNLKTTRYEKDYNAHDNVVWLTREQHIQVHQLLYELNSDIRDEMAHLGLSGMLGKDEIFTKLCALGGSHSGEKKRGVPRPVEVRRKCSLGSMGNTSRALNWKVITPTNEVLTIFNMAQFCRENDLSLKHMSRASKGGWRHKGHRCTKL